MIIRTWLDGTKYDGNFVNGKIYTDYKVLAKNDRVDVYINYQNLMNFLGAFPEEIKFLFIPDSIMCIANPVASNFSGRNLDATIFHNYKNFNNMNSFIGFWKHITTGKHVMITDIQYSKEYKIFTINGDIPTYVDQFDLIIIGMRSIKQVQEFPKETEWVSFSTEKMPLPKDNIIIFQRERNDQWVPNTGEISLTEYYPNIYKISNPENKDMKFVALYENNSQNEHISYDNEIAPYMMRMDLLEKYRDGSINETLKEFKPLPWNYNIDDFLEKNKYTKLNFNDLWDSFLYKMDTISNMLKHWSYMYEEYSRRTYGFLSGWYHNISNYTNMEDKIRLNTQPEIEDPDWYTEFDEPQYLFSYANDMEFGNVNSYCFYIDGKFTIPTKIIVYRNIQYVYFPKKLIKPTSVIEVERFDGNVFTRDFTLPNDGITIPIKELVSRPTIANCLFIVGENGSYLNNGEIDTYVIDPDVGEVKIDLNTSVYSIDLGMSLKLVPVHESVIDTKIKLCCNNATFQFYSRESGVDFTWGRVNLINLNELGYITNIKQDVLPRIRIYDENGRLIPKRSYEVYKHNNYNEKAKFFIPIRHNEDRTFTVSYIGYDEKLIYHRDNIPANGFVSIEGKTTRPLNLAYHDVYLNGLRLTKYDIDVVGPFHFIIKNLGKFDSLSNLEIYEKSHATDDFIKFDYGEQSEYIMDKLINNDAEFYQKVIDALEEFTPSGLTSDIDDIRDWFYSLFTDYLPYTYINGDERKDLELYFHVFNPTSGRVLLNADDRVRYIKRVHTVYHI